MLFLRQDVAGKILNIQDLAGKSLKTVQALAVKTLNIQDLAGRF